MSTKREFLAAALTDEQKSMFDNLGVRATNVAVMSGLFRGQQVGILVATHDDPSGSTDTLIVPVAILCDEAFLATFRDEFQDSYGSALLDLKDRPSCLS